MDLPHQQRAGGDGQAADVETVSELVPHREAQLLILRKRKQALSQRHDLTTDELRAAPTVDQREAAALGDSDDGPLVGERDRIFQSTGRV